MVGDLSAISSIRATERDYFVLSYYQMQFASAIIGVLAEAHRPEILSNYIESIFKIVQEILRWIGNSKSEVRWYFRTGNDFGPVAGADIGVKTRGCSQISVCARVRYAAKLPTFLPFSPIFERCI